MLANQFKDVDRWLAHRMVVLSDFLAKFVDAGNELIGEEGVGWASGPSGQGGFFDAPLDALEVSPKLAGAELPPHLLCA
jgi:hypothetical protein